MSQPVADDLLATARETVLQELLPQLPASAHYTARMVANAIAIARREQATAAPDVQFGTVFREIIGAREHHATSWRNELVERLRAGAFDHDPGLRARMMELLVGWTRSRVAIANPRILDTPAA